MTWSVTVPGQPVSWDDAYRTGKMPVKRGGVPVLGADGNPRSIHRPIKTDRAAKYQDDVILVTKAARPSSWVTPTGQIYIVIGLFLTNDIDCDNSTKLALDGIAKAIGCNDRQFMPLYYVKETNVPLVQAKVVFVFPDDVNLQWR